MFENPRRGRQARNFTTNVPKILEFISSSEQIFSENWRWVNLIDCSHKSLRVHRRNFVKIFVSERECCRREKSHKFCLIWFFATCCCDKILSQRQRFSQRVVRVATCCCKLSPSVYRTLKLLVISVHIIAAPRPMLGNSDSGIQEFLLGELWNPGLETVILLRKPEPH